MSEERIARLINARAKRIEYSFMSNREYAAKMEALCDLQTRLYRRYKIIVPTI